MYLIHHKPNCWYRLPADDLMAAVKLKLALK